MIDALYRILEQENVRVEYSCLHNKHHLLDAYVWPSKNLIVLDHSLRFRTRQFKCVLAEEVGHILYPPASSGIVYHMLEYWECDSIERSKVAYYHAKNERAALLWATAFLIPDRDFWIFAHEEPRDWYEWLERFDVEDWFMRKKIGFMRAQKPFKWREITNKTAMTIGGFDA